MSDAERGARTNQNGTCKTNKKIRTLRLLYITRRPPPRVNKGKTNPSAPGCVLFSITFFDINSEAVMLTVDFIAFVIYPGDQRGHKEDVT